MKKDGFELYLSNDIVQGEDIPFYLLWDDDDLKEINIEYSGFSGICELYNVRDEFSTDNLKILKSDLKKDNYLGGSLKTDKTDVPFKKGLLKITIHKCDGTTFELYEERTLYTTCLEVSPLLPSKLLSQDEPLLKFELTGSTTVFIDIETDADSDLQLVLPIEIQNSMEKLINSLIKGFDELKLKYPDNPLLIFFDDLFHKPEKLSGQQYLEKLGIAIQNYKMEDEFKEALGRVFYNAVNSESDILNQVIRPFIEYFESLAAEKVFLNSPFLNLEILEGKNTFKGKITYQNIIEREEMWENINSNEDFFEVTVDSDKKRTVPLKDFISIIRIKNDSAINS